MTDVAPASIRQPNRDEVERPASRSTVDAMVTGNRNANVKVAIKLISLADW